MPYKKKAFHWIQSNQMTSIAIITARKSFQIKAWVQVYIRTWYTVPSITIFSSLKMKPSFILPHLCNQLMQNWSIKHSFHCHLVLLLTQTRTNHYFFRLLTYLAYTGLSWIIFSFRHMTSFQFCQKRKKQRRNGSNIEEATRKGIIIHTTTIQIRNEYEFQIRQDYTIDNEWPELVSNSNKNVIELSCWLADHIRYAGTQTKISDTHTPKSNEREWSRKKSLAFDDLMPKRAKE